MSGRAYLGCCLTVLLTLVACGGDEDPVAPPPPPPPPPPVSITLSPTTVTVGAGGSQNFTATVTNATNPAVTWSSSGGTLTSTGASASWVAPVAGGSFTVTATSVEDPTKNAAATVTVTPVVVAIEPAEVSLFRGQPVSFIATVTGAAETGVTWDGSCEAGAADGGTLNYTAPETPGECTFTATSVIDPTRSATATVTIRPEWLVTAADDTDDGDCTWSHCSLREALAVAQAEPDPEAIIIGTDAAPVTGTITLTSALPDLTTAVAIHGPGAAELTIDADASEVDPRRVFTVTGDVAVTLSGMTLTGGFTDVGGGMLISGAEVALTEMTLSGNEATSGGGGGLLAHEESTVRLHDTSVENNRTSGPVASSLGAGIRVLDGSVIEMIGGAIRDNTAGSHGGGLNFGNNSQGTLSGVTIEGNAAAGSGGGIMIGVTSGNTATLTISNSWITDNNGGTNGGGVAMSGVEVRSTITSTVIAGNTSTNTGGGFFANGGEYEITDSEIRENTAQSAGGLLITGLVSMTMTGSTVAGNGAEFNYGGMQFAGGVNSTLLMDDVEIAENTSGLNGAPTSGVVGGMGITAGNSVTLTRLTIRDNVSNQYGAGLAIANATVTASELTVIRNSTNTFGGGIYVTGASVLRLSRSIVAENSAGLLGGGIGALNEPPTLELDQVLVRDNTTAGSGGGLFARSALTRVENSTFSGNHAVVNGGGVGVTGAVRLTNVTIVGNTADTRGGGLSSTQGAGQAGGIGAPILTNVLLADNTMDGAAENCGLNGTAIIVSEGHNLSDDASCEAFTELGDLSETPAGVDPELKDNGGPTWTHALLEGSAAIDAGLASACSATDQRGFGRQGVCDIGAFEFDGVAPEGMRVAARAGSMVTSPPRLRQPVTDRAFRMAPPQGIILTIVRH